MARDLAGWAEDIRRRGVVWGIDSAASAREASLSMEALAAVLRVVAEKHECLGVKPYYDERDCPLPRAVLAALAPLAPLFPDTEGGGDE